MSVLINHKGAVEVTHDQLNKLPEPLGKTDTHTPIHHGRFVTLVKDTAKAEGLEIMREEYSLRTGEPKRDPNGFPVTHGYDDMFGLLTVRSELSGVNHCIGLRGSNTMNFSRQLGAGNHVTVCDNLVFAAQVVIGRKHTSEILSELPTLIVDALRKVTMSFDYDAIRTDVYKNRRVNDIAAHDVMMESIQRGSKEQRTPASKLTDWLGEWHEPSHDEFKPRNAWSLLNAHTEVAKTWQHDVMAKRTEKVLGIMDEAFGVHKAALGRLSDRYTAEQIDECQIAFAA